MSGDVVWAGRDVASATQRAEADDGLAGLSSKRPCWRLPARCSDASARGLAHTSTADSIHTLAVSEAGGAGTGCTSPCSTGGGGGNGGPGGDGGNGASANGSSGSGASGANAGSGLTVSLAGLGLVVGANGVGQLGTATRWHVSLSVSRAACIAARRSV